MHNNDLTRLDSLSVTSRDIPFQSKVHTITKNELKTEMDVTSSAAAVTMKRHVFVTALSVHRGFYLFIYHNPGIDMKASGKRCGLLMTT